MSSRQDKAQLEIPFYENFYENFIKNNKKKIVYSESHEKPGGGLMKTMDLTNGHSSALDLRCS